MLRVFIPDEKCIQILDREAPIPDGAIWIDMDAPDAEEERKVEAFLGIDVPTREEMHEIESSSRLYRDGDVLFMTATLLCRADSQNPGNGPVTFILSGDRLTTVRYIDPRPLVGFGEHGFRDTRHCATGPLVLLCLLEAIVDRVADVLEYVGEDLENVSRGLFGAETAQQEDELLDSAFNTTLRRIGIAQAKVAKARDSLITLARLLSFLRIPQSLREQPEIAARLGNLDRDIRSLTDQVDFLSNNITFLLDASLGMINIEQNGIIKIFSVMAVIFLPPTLVASIYGMNFINMPELQWFWGYPFALLLMVAGAVLPFWFFKRKGWL